MIWKIFFAITALFLFIITLIGFNMSHLEGSNFDIVIGVICALETTLILGVFYSLGWKQQIFSKKILKILFSLFIIGLLFPLIDLGMQTYSISYTETQNTTISIFASLFEVSFLTIFINILLVPFYIGVHKYNKIFENLVLIEKPYWKLFTIYCIIPLSSFLILAFTKYMHFNLYNFIDFFVILSCIYEIVFLISYAWNKKIFSRLFWQITAIPYVLIMIISPFFISKTFMQDFSFFNFLNNPVETFSNIPIGIAFCYALYDYTFKKEA